MRHSSGTQNVTSVNNKAGSKQAPKAAGLQFGPFRCAALVVAVVLGIAVPTNVRADHVSWLANVESALRTANDTNRLVLMKFTAEWCGPCKRYERETFARPAVAQYVNQNFVPVLVDIDERKELAKQLNVSRVPAVLIVSPEMIILSRTTGFQSEQKLLPGLQKIVASYVRSGPSSASRTAAAKEEPSTPALPVSQQVVSAEPQTATPEIMPVPPVDNDGPAFGGLCLSAVQETRSLVAGKPTHALRYRNKVLHFSSVQQMQCFREDPEKYWPQNDGICPVTVRQTGQSVEGKLKYAVIFRKKVWLLNSAENMKTFVAEPEVFLAPAAARPANP